MNTRREFLENAAGALAGLAFVGCDLLAAAPARAQARRREVVVSGRRVKVVDVHAHCQVPEAMALMGMKLATPGSTLPPILDMATQASDRIRAMDEQGIDVEALSINAYWYKAERDLASQLIKIQNEKLAAACAANPDYRLSAADLRKWEQANGTIPASSIAVARTGWGRYWPGKTAPDWLQVSLVSDKMPSLLERVFGSRPARIRQAPRQPE